MTICITRETIAVGLSLLDARDATTEKDRTEYKWRTWTSFAHECWHHWISQHGPEILKAMLDRELLDFAEMRSALQPLAAIADAYGDDMPDAAPISPPHIYPKITVGDARLAKAALTPIQTSEAA